jgi:DNA-directed RNA polymerase subunit H (RpoH/RPB5)
MDYETLHTLYASRKTLLKILASRGYETTPFEKFGPVEISAMANAGSTAFRMDLVRKEGSDSDAAVGSAPPNCRVLYSLNRIKNRISTFVSEVMGEEGTSDAIDPETTQVIVMLLEPVVEAFHTAAYNAYATRKKMRISFFQAHTLVNNPLDHVLVPRHEVMPAGEVAEFLKENKIKTKLNLPVIKFHEDMIARILGIVPEEIVKITRPSPSAGEYVSYRVCLP